MARCDTSKIIQAAGILFKEHAGAMSRLRLLKLLYIADRECLQETLHPITFDTAVAMDNGPVLSKTYNLLKGAHLESQVWDQFIQRVGPRDMKLIADPGVSKLSKLEIDKLINVSRKFSDNNDWDVAEFTHNYPEWLQNRPEPKSQKQITFDARMSALGFGDDQKAQVLSAHREDMEIEKLVAQAARQ